MKHSEIIRDFSSVQYEQLIDSLRVADDEYFNTGTPIVSDKEYDQARKYAFNLNPKHPYFMEVGSTVRGDAVELPFPMPSLDQIYEGELNRWVSKNFGNKEVKFCVTDKMDGASALLVIDNYKLKCAYSRGDSISGADITRHISKISHFCPSLKNGIVRCEIEIANEKFESLPDTITASSGERYKNPRNMVSGVLNRKDLVDTRIYNVLDVIAYQVVWSPESEQFNTKSEELTFLREHGFKVPEFEVWEHAQFVEQNLIEHVEKRKNECAYDIDGVVIYVDNLSQALDMDQNVEAGNNPKSAIKYKINQDVAVSIVTQVEWNVSKDGYLKPIVHFEPVMLDKATITKATGFNAAFIRDNCIGPGAAVEIIRSGQVIPYIQSVATPASAPQLPDIPYVWNDTKIDAIVEDKTSMTEVLIEQLVHFSTSMDIDLLREGNIRVLVETGSVTSCEDLLTLTMPKYVSLLGVNGSKIYANITKRLKDIELHVLMGSVPYFGRGVGRKKFKQLIKQIGSDYHKWTKKDIVNSEGFDEKTATKIIQGIDRFDRFFETVKHKVSLKEIEQKKNGLLIGEKICVTGFRDSNLNQMIEIHGGENQTGVSSKTTILVCLDPSSNSGKVKKAKEINDSGKGNILIVSKEQFLEKLSGN